MYLIYFYDVIETIIKYEKSFSSGEITLKISIERGFTLGRGSRFFFKEELPQK